MKCKVIVQGAVLNLGGKSDLSSDSTKSCQRKRSIRPYVSIYLTTFRRIWAKYGFPVVQREHLQCKSSGLTIVEAMIAFAILSLGLMASIKMMVNMRVGGQVAQQRMVAIDYASNYLEELRAAGACSPLAATKQPKRIQDTTEYTLQATCTGNVATVKVNWNDSRGGQTQVDGTDNEVVFDSEI